MRHYPALALVVLGGVLSIWVSARSGAPLVLAQSSQPRLVVFEIFNST